MIPNPKNISRILYSDMSRKSRGIEGPISRIPVDMRKASDAAVPEKPVAIQPTTGTYAVTANDISVKAMVGSMLRRKSTIPS